MVRIDQKLEYFIFCDNLNKEIKKENDNNNKNDFKEYHNIIKKYLNNPDKYEGVILDRLENQYFLNKYKYYYPNLTISYSDFGFINETFAVNKKDTNFLNDVDSAIIKLQDTGGIEDVCKIYRDKDQVNLCIR